MAPPILDLDQLDGPTVRISGTEYALVTPGGLPPLASHRLIRMTSRVEALVRQETLSQDEERELGVLPDQMCRLVLEAPDAVHAALTDRQRMEVVSVFLARPTPIPLPETPSQAGSTIGASLSPASAGSTAGLP